VVQRHGHIIQWQQNNLEATMTIMTEQEKQQEHVSDDLKVFVSRIPANFDEGAVQRILEAKLGRGAVMQVAFGYDQEETDDRFDDRPSKKKKTEEERKHKGFAFVVLKNQELVKAAIELKSVKGGRKQDSNKQHTLYIGPCLTDEEKEIKSSKTCFLWAQNRCPYGDQCKFSHRGPGSLVERKDKKQRKCRDHRKGKCKLSDADCPFSHDFDVKPRVFEPKPDSEKDCINWKTKGKCRRLDQCPYRHDPAVRDAVLAKKNRKIDNKKRNRNPQPITVRVFGLNYETTESDVREFFSDCGPITKVDLPVFEDSGRSKGYCGVSFQSPKAVAQAVKLNGTELQGRWLSVQPGKMYLEDWEKHHTDRVAAKTGDSKESHTKARADGS
jgi:RNA recognition motif-containing protein